MILQSLFLPLAGNWWCLTYPLETIEVFSFQGSVAPRYGKQDVSKHYRTSIKEFFRQNLAL